MPPLSCQIMWHFMISCGGLALVPEAQHARGLGNPVSLLLIIRFWLVWALLARHAWFFNTCVRLNISRNGGSLNTALKVHRAARIQGCWLVLFQIESTDESHSSLVQFWPLFWSSVASSRPSKFIAFQNILRLVHKAGYRHGLWQL